MPNPYKNPEILWLEVGGTCFIPSIHIDTLIRRIWHYRPMRFSCRTVVKHGVTGVRVRRVA